MTLHMLKLSCLLCLFAKTIITLHRYMSRQIRYCLDLSYGMMHYMLLLLLCTKQLRDFTFVLSLREWMAILSAWRNSGCTSWSYVQSLVRCQSPIFVSVCGCKICLSKWLDTIKRTLVCFFYNSWCNMRVFQLEELWSQNWKSKLVNYQFVKKHVRLYLPLEASTALAVFNYM